MSKIGKRIIEIPEGVTVEIGKSTLNVKGSNGEFSIEILKGIKPELQENQLTFSPEGKSKQILSNWGTMNSITQNAIDGSIKDFEKELSIVGVGYKAAIEGNVLVLSLGFSHPIRFPIPEDIKIEVDKNNLKISGPSKWLVGETAAKIRKFRKPEPYQGKGIRYKDEVVRRKAGKKTASSS